MVGISWNHALPPIVKLKRTYVFLQVEKLEGQLDAKDNEIAHLVQKHASEVSRLNQELRALREDYDAKIREYEALMDLKVQLDQEIATYRALLQQEETRSVCGSWQRSMVRDLICPQAEPDPDPTRGEAPFSHPEHRAGGEEGSYGYCHHSAAVPVF